MAKKQSIHDQLGSLVSLAEQMGNPLTAIYIRLSGLKKPRHKKSQINMLRAIEKDLERLDLAVQQLIVGVGTILESEAQANKPKEMIHSRQMTLR